MQRCWLGFAVQAGCSCLQWASCPSVRAEHTCPRLPARPVLAAHPPAGGELLDAVLEKGHYSEADARSCFLQIMRAIEYLHSRCAWASACWLCCVG